jgi:hypothetical protein
MGPHLVLDWSAVVPYRKPSEVERAIVELGDALPDADAVVYLSKEMLEVKVKRDLERNHPLPYLQRWLLRVFDKLKQKTAAPCHQIRAERKLIKLHLLGRRDVERYDVSGLGLRKEDDRKVLRAALAAASRCERVSLAVADRDFIEALDWAKLMRRYEEARRVEVVEVDDFIVRLCGLLAHVP